MTRSLARSLDALIARALGPGDLTAVLALHQSVRADMPPDLIAAETPAFFADHLERRGRLQGWFAGDRLVAYGVLGLPGPRDPNFGRFLDLPEQALAGVAHLDGAAVAPDWRGLGLQRRLSLWRLEQARAAGRRLAVTTIAPGNLPSLANGLAVGLRIRARRAVFGGQRFVLALPLAEAPPPPEGAEAVWLAVGEAARQTRLLDAGFEGLALRRGSPEPALLFAPPRCP